MTPGKLCYAALWCLARRYTPSGGHKPLRTVPRRGYIAGQSPPCSRGGAGEGAGEALGYMLAQVIGAIAGSAVLYALVHTGAVAVGATETGANSFAEGNLVPALIAETVFTFIFVFVVLRTTDPENGAGNFAGLAIGLTLVLVHIVCIPVTGTSVNPARSIGPALFEQGEALRQLWVFIVAPLAGGALAALACRK